MSFPLVFGTDIGPAHVCRGTIYRYDVQIEKQAQHELCTVFATCITCGKIALAFELAEPPPHARAVREAHHAAFWRFVRRTA